MCEYGAIRISSSAGATTSRPSDILWRVAKGPRENVDAGSRGAFGARLRRMREMAGLTQEELAGRAGLSPNAVSALERGQRKRPYLHTVRALADALGLPEDGRVALLEAVPERGETAPSGAETAKSASTLPRPVTALVGREGDLEQVAALISDPETRLLTLTGIGGVGKTRLATEAAREVEALFPDGVAFVGLASLADPALVVPTVLRSLGQGEAEGRPSGEVLIEHLTGKRMLLVLDNFEQLLEAAPEVAALIEGCPDLTVLVTSRAPLRVRGEREYGVPPLALPATTRSPDEADVAASPSGKLFMERARAVSSAFEITGENAAAVATICWRLAGLPLALELAAAKVRFLSPAALLPRLDQALSAAWARDLPQRQRTMRAALDWSYDLLSPPEQALLRRLSVFAGGFTLEAAEVVGGVEDSEAWEVIEHLGALVEQSLVLVGAGEEETEARYGMLEPVRQYARERLEEQGGAKEARRAHAAFFLNLAEQAEPGLRSTRQVTWLERLEQEADNVRAAMSWALSSGDYDTAAGLGWGLHSFWWIHGHHQEACRWMETALEHEMTPTARARALHAAGSASFAQGDYIAAEKHWREALSIAWDGDDALAEGNAWSGVGLVEMVRPDYEAAASNIERAIALFERLDEGYLASVLRVFLGTTLLARGDGEQAELRFGEALASARRLEVPSLYYIALYNMAQSALARDDHEKAARMLREGIEWSERTKDRANLAYFLQALAAIAASRGEAEHSAVLLGAAEGALRDVGASVYNFYRPDPLLPKRAATESQASLGETAFEEARARGTAMTFDEAIGYALGSDAR